jgi:hypothetical protein
MFSDLFSVDTGERPTQDSFERYCKQGGPAVLFMNTEEMVRIAIGTRW